MRTLLAVITVHLLSLQLLSAEIIKFEIFQELLSFYSQAIDQGDFKCEYEYSFENSKDAVHFRNGMSKILAYDNDLRMPHWNEEEIQKINKKYDCVIVKRGDDYYLDYINERLNKMRYLSKEGKYSISRDNFPRIDVMHENTLHMPTISAALVYVPYMTTNASVNNYMRNDQFRLEKIFDGANLDKNNDCKIEDLKKDTYKITVPAKAENIDSLKIYYSATISLKDSAFKILKIERFGLKDKEKFETLALSRFRTVEFSNHKEVAPGLFLPHLITSPHYSSLSGYSGRLSVMQKKDVEKEYGDLSKDYLVCVTRFKVKSVDFKPQEPIDNIYHEKSFVVDRVSGETYEVKNKSATMQKK